MNRQEAIIFARRWEGRGKERQDTQKFWQEFFHRVLEVPDPYDFAEFEKPVKILGAYNGPKLKGNVPLAQTQLPIANPPSRRRTTEKGIDVYIESADTIIEQKSFGKSLDEQYRQSDGEYLTPFEQAWRYNAGMLHGKHARYIITCNFQTFRIYDLHYQETLFNDGFVEVSLSELPDNLDVFDFLVREHQEQIVKQKTLSIEAATLMAKLKDELLKEYKLLELPASDLTVLMVRLLFCMYAEDAGLFQNGQFREYLRTKKPDQQTGEFHRALIDLFKVLNTPTDRRSMLAGDLDSFPYVNGGLFAGEIAIPWFTDNSKHILLQDCCTFNWSDISPVLFGALFESVLSPGERHDGGMHYTSVENIRKVTKPLFLEDLDLELRRAGNSKAKLERLQDRLASLTWFDPACGSGNFLTQTYIDIRRIENVILERLVDPDGTGQISMGISGNIAPKVSIKQFYGVEVNDFAVHVAETAMQIANHQMDVETSTILQRTIDSLPLTKQTGIVKGNALTMDWSDIVPAEQCDYILGNPPFLGAKIMSAEQKQEVVSLFPKVRLANSIDYVAAWYVKAAEMMHRNEAIRTCFVSTNSICQGQQVAPIWRTLQDRYQIEIDFAYRPFVWNSESTEQAHVHVVIVGFSIKGKASRIKRLYDGNDAMETKQINAYLCDAPNVIVESASKPICVGAPECDYGSLINDDGNFIFKPDQLEAFLNLEPGADKFIRPLMGADELIKGSKRYVLYLRDITSQELKEMPLVHDRIIAVRNKRLASSAAPTRKSAETPHRFYFDGTTDSRFLCIPSTSSERRRYVPMVILDPIYVATNATSTISNVSLYQFGVLQSQFHNAWMRSVAGRLETRYRYSPKTVYNTFPWPGASPENNGTPVDELVPRKIREAIESAAQRVLDSRANYPGSSLAELYDPDNDFLFPELTKAHRELDKAVERAYGRKFDGDEEKIVSHLFEMYAELTDGE